MGDLAFVSRPSAEGRDEHGGNIYDFKGRDIIDFSANINPLGLPQGVKRAIYKNFSKVLHYPDPKAKKLIARIAKYWGINEKNILLGNGSSELIYLAMAAYKPKTTLITVPTFSEYERAAKSVKSKIHYLKLNEKEGFKLDLSQVPYGDTFFLCNPNNPTGNLILQDRNAITKLPNKLVIADEAFMDFLPEEKKYTLIREAVKTKKIIVLRTLTKFFALPGLRMGYAIAHKNTVDRLKEHQAPWNTNIFAQIAAELILDDEGYIDKTHKLIDREREFLFRGLTSIEGVKPYPSVTNFILIKLLNRNITSSGLTQGLIRKKILIRDCSNFRGLNSRFIRVAVRSRKENLKLLNALREEI